MGSWRSPKQYSDGTLQRQPRHSGRTSDSRPVQYNYRFRIRSLSPLLTKEVSMAHKQRRKAASKKGPQKKGLVQVPRLPPAPDK